MISITKLISKAFEKLSEAESIEAVERILTDLKIPKKYQLNETTYPQISFKITKEEITELRKNNIIDENNHISKIIPESPLTKLLYAVVWKNGDLHKLRHIVDGIESESGIEKNNALVFFQFGKYLTKKQGEPIIDQHVIRAFGIFMALKPYDHIEIDRLTKLSSVKKIDKNIINKYKNWHTTSLSCHLRKYDNYSYHVDKVLFALGKMAKATNTHP